MCTSFHDLNDLERSEKPLLHYFHYMSRLPEQRLKCLHREDCLISADFLKTTHKFAQVKMTVGCMCMKSALFALRDAITAEVVGNTLLFRSLLHDTYARPVSER